MSIATAMSKYGSGVGYIYAVDSAGNIIESVQNSTFGRQAMESAALLSSPLTSNVSASSTVEIASGAGTITNLSYDGVSIFNTGVPVTGATTTDLATNLRDAINAHLSVPEYTAVSSGNIVTVYADPSLGGTLNGVSSVGTTTGTLVMNVGTLDGGTATSDEVDYQVGFNIYLNASPSATASSLVGATDITSAVVKRSASTPFIVSNDTIASGSISVDRVGTINILNVDTEGAIAADDLLTIQTGNFTNGDMVIIRGVDPARVVTVKEGDNIELGNNADFVSGDKDSGICLQLFDNVWYETFRTPANVVSVSTLRSAGIPQPVSGIEVSAITLSGASTTITPGVDKGYWALTGSGTLTGNVAYNLAAGTVEGDTISIRFGGGITLGGFSLSFNGISLTQQKATYGALAVFKWEGSSWIPSLFDLGNAVDYATSADLATKEDSLGNPAFDGYILSSTAGGTRSWISNASTALLGTVAATVGNSAGVETDLGVITLGAGTLSTDGSSVKISAGGGFASNANAKTLRLRFDSLATSVVNVLTAAPNGVDWYMDIVITRYSNTTVAVSSVMMIKNSPVELENIVLGGLDLAATSYDLRITGDGVAGSDTYLHNALATKYIV